LVETARPMRLNEREQAHLAALSHLVQGSRAAAVAVLDRHLMRYPFDLVAHQGAALADGFLGRFYWVRDRYGFETSSCRAGCHGPAGAANLTLPATAWKIFA